MTWEEFREFFMGKFFLASTRHGKAREFLELKQGSMTILEYVAKFTKLARFGDDYVVTDMAKVRKFEDGLKLSIRIKLVAARHSACDKGWGAHRHALGTHMTWRNALDRVFLS